MPNASKLLIIDMGLGTEKLSKGDVMRVRAETLHHAATGPQPTAASLRSRPRFSSVDSFFRLPIRRALTSVYSKD